MNSPDIRSTLRDTLTQKQELVRDYQTFAQQIDNNEVANMYRNFAETEALHATQLKENLERLS